jgi:hypothetical protein
MAGSRNRVAEVDKGRRMTLAHGGYVRLALESTVARASHLTILHAGTILPVFFEDFNTSVNTDRVCSTIHVTVNEDCVYFRNALLKLRIAQFRILANRVQNTTNGAVKKENVYEGVQIRRIAKKFAESSQKSIPYFLKKRPFF